MPLSGSPPTYTRGYSFTTHSVNQPNVPQPGDKLDQEFDDIATCISETAGAVQGITNPDGTLKTGIVGEAQLQPGLFDSITLDAANALQPLVDSAATSANTALSWASYAQSSAAQANASASIAAGAVADTEAARTAAQAAGSQAGNDAASAADSAAAAANSATTSENAMVQSLMHSETSFNWAEYLAGPVAPAPPGWPEAIDDGMWSAKWWAVRAAEIIGDYGKWYLGAFASAPPLDPGNPWPPGTLYYDTTTGKMMVWDGTAWQPLTSPGPTVQFAYVYRAAADQQDFSGPDFFGNVPALNGVTPEPSEVYVNGTRIVQGDATFGDFSIDPLTSTLHINTPLMVDSVVQWNVLVPPNLLRPGGIFAAHKLLPLTFDGTQKDFPIAYNDGLGDMPAATTAGVQLQIVLDGVPQEAGVDFTSAADMLHLADAPPAGTRFWGVWYEPAP